MLSGTPTRLAQVYQSMKDGPVGSTEEEARSWAQAASMLAGRCQHKCGPSPFSQPEDPEVNTRAVLPPSQIFMQLCLATPPGSLAWSCLWSPGDSGHSDTGSSSWWFPGTPDHSPKILFFPTPGMEPHVDKGPS
ncbi:uncharacterized protein RBU33_013491 isoform 1-T1 [Hipposideros larvatus]